MESRMIKREKLFCWLKAILCAMKEKTFTIKSYILLLESTMDLKLSSSISRFKNKPEADK